jgi:hypothetical protein
MAKKRYPSHQSPGIRSTPSSEFHLPPGVTQERQNLPNGGWGYTFRHGTLGEVGRVVVQGIGPDQTHFSYELIGDPEDPMTPERRAVFEPICQGMMHALDERVGSVKGPHPIPIKAPSATVGIESRVILCDRCSSPVALLIFAEGETLGHLEDYTRMMFQKVRQLNVPTWVIGPPRGDRPPMDQPANTLKIWPKREPLERLSPNEFNPRLDILIAMHCAGRR